MRINLFHLSTFSTNLSTSFLFCTPVCTMLLYGPDIPGVVNRALYRVHEGMDLCRTAPGGTVMWFILALLSSVFAAATSILAKIGIDGVNSTLATAIRTSVVLLMSWGKLAVLLPGFAAGQSLSGGPHRQAEHRHHPAFRLSSVERAGHSQGYPGCRPDHGRHPADDRVTAFSVSRPEIVKIGLHFHWLNTILMIPSGRAFPQGRAPRKNTQRGCST